MKISLLITLVLICAIAGCKIDESRLPQKTAINPLLIGAWYIKAAVNTHPGLTPDTVTSFTAKDYFMFNGDYTVKASSSQPDTSTTTHYIYQSNVSGQQIIIGNTSNGFTTYTIDKLTTDSLIMDWTLSITVGTATTSIPITYKLAHK